MARPGQLQKVFGVLTLAAKTEGVVGMQREIGRAWQVTCRVDALVIDLNFFVL